MTTIRDIRGRTILDSRGNPTVEAEVHTSNNIGRAAVPSGASTGKYEAVELRDGQGAFHGLGVNNAINNIHNKISPALKGIEVTDQKTIDETMNRIDGTKNKSNLGANATLAVSMAVARAAAHTLETPLYNYLGTNPYLLPTPAMNVINGGKHAGNNLEIQEYLIMPTGSQTFSNAIQICQEIYHTLKKFISSKYGKEGINVGDEGGFAPPLTHVRDPLNLIEEAVEECGYEKHVKLALDAAASEFHQDGKYHLDKPYTSEELVDFYKNLIKDYPFASIEDPFDQDDWKGFALITREISDKIQILGDDIFVTNIERLKKGIAQGAGNALLLKPNQIGTISEAIEAAKVAFKNNYGVMVSHRSGETCDDFIADLVVSLNAGQIKSGAPCRGERTAKYNRLIRIEEYLGRKCRYAGKNFHNNPYK
jgi:enolase